MLKLNRTKVNVTIFPDRTSQVWQLDPDIPFKDGWNAELEWDFESEDEFMHLAQLVSLLKQRNAHKITLNMKYLPYGRQDKEISNDATFALHTFAKLLNSLDLDEVTCLDPHSNVAEKLIAGFRPYYPKLKLLHGFYVTESDIFCYPDAGAKSKYSEIFENPYIYGNKVRDQETGWITSFELVGDPKDKKVYIVDDICDGGMTFKILTKSLLEQGAKEVNLFVTHGLFSKGLKTLTDAGINRIFTSKGEAIRVSGGLGFGIMYKPIGGNK